MLLNSEDEARSYERRDLELAYCAQCGFIFNHIFDREVVEYAAVTEESQHYSGTFSSFAKQLAREIATVYALDGKHVLEIGCGKGDFLIELCGLANCTGLGIDPGFSQQRIDSTTFAVGYDAEQIKFIAEYFDTAHNIPNADLIMCRHTLEHIPDVLRFVKTMRSSIRNCDAGVFFETPDADRVLREGAFWDIYYEHCSYFTCSTHAALFKRAGFAVDTIRLDYAKQYIIQYAHPELSYRGDSAPEPDDAVQISGLVASFQEKVAKTQSFWLEFLREKNAIGGPVVTWGGGSKSVAFLTTLGAGGLVDRVIDINPFKQGKYLAGSGHKVIAPSELPRIAPAVVIVMNPIYFDEISQMIKSIGLSCDIVAV